MRKLNRNSLVVALTATVITLASASAAAPKTVKNAKNSKNAQQTDTLKLSAASASRSTVDADHISSHGGSNVASNLVDRALILPANTLQASTEVGLNHTSLFNTGETGFATNYGFEMGLGNKMQVGAALNIPFAPKFTLGYFIADVQYGVTNFMNVRLNLGMNAVTYPSGYTYNMTDGTYSYDRSVQRSFAGGIGAPLRYKMDRNWALISGRSNILSVIHTPGYLSAQTDDIFTWDLNSKGNYTTLGLPMGVEHSFNAQWSGRFRTGIRGVMGSGSGTYIPLGFDAMYVPARNLDLGATVAFAGAVSGTGNGYFDNQNFTLWGQTRF